MPRLTQNRKTRIAARRSKYVVFLSHSSRDNWIAQVMSERIQSVGATPWIDEKDLQGGDVLVDEIIKGIDACDEALVLVTPNSATSQWVSFEIGAVRAQHKRITPILYSVALESLATMKDVKAIELNGFDDFVKQLKRRITSG